MIYEHSSLLKTIEYRELGLQLINQIISNIGLLGNLLLETKIPHFILSIGTLIYQSCVNNLCYIYNYKYNYIGPLNTSKYVLLDRFAYVVCRPYTYVCMLAYVESM